MFLDTVKLVVQLPHPMASTQYEFRGHEWKKIFSPGLKRYVFQDKVRKLLALADANYVPRIEYRVRETDSGEVHELLLEFSVPKLLYGNNFMLAHPRDLDEVYRRLLDAVNYVYAFYDVTESMIKNGTLSRIDCMITVKFPNLAAHNAALKRIASTSIDSRYEISKPRYSARSSGVSITCNSWQFVFYDKNEEVKRYFSPKKKMQYEANGDLLFIDDGLQQVCEDNRVVFMQCEVRFNQKAKIDRALKHIGEDPHPLTLAEAIEKEIPKRLLRAYWQIVLNGLPRLDIQQADEKEVFEVLMRGGLSGKKLAASFFAARAVRNYDMQELRALYVGSGSMNTKNSRWRRFLNTVEDLPALSAADDPVDYITKAILSDSVDTNNDVAPLDSWSLSITLYYMCKNAQSQVLPPYKVARSPPIIFGCLALRP